MREYNVDGIILCPAANTPASLIERIQSWRMPCILFSRNVAGAAADYVGANNRSGVYAETRHLVDLGHRRIAFIGVNESISSGRERLQGYIDALHEVGLPIDDDLIVKCPATRADGMAIARDLLGRADPPTAATCFNDILAFGVMLHLHAKNLTPGRDFSVTGFDDISEAKLWQPALTTVSVSRAAIGEGVINLLNRRLQEPDAPPKSILIDTALVFRNSTGPAKRS